MGRKGLLTFPALHGRIRIYRIYSRTWARGDSFFPFLFKKFKFSRESWALQSYSVFSSALATFVCYYCVSVFVITE